jgi:hypothetical protein
MESEGELEVGGEPALSNRIYFVYQLQTIIKASCFSIRGSSCSCLTLLGIDFKIGHGIHLVLEKLAGRRMLKSSDMTT